MHTGGADEPVRIFMKKNLNHKQDAIIGHSIVNILEEDERLIIVPFKKNVSKHISWCIGGNFTGCLEEITRYESRLVEEVGSCPGLKIWVICYVWKGSWSTNTTSLFDNRWQIEKGECEMCCCRKTKQSLFNCGSTTPNIRNRACQ